MMVKKTAQMASEHISECAWGFSCRYSPGPVAAKAMSFQLQHSSSLESHNPLAEEQEEEGLLTDPNEKRFVPLLPAVLLQCAGYSVPPAQEQTSSPVSPKPSPMSRAMSCCPPPARTH